VQWAKSHKVFIYLHLLTCACLIKFEAPEQSNQPTKRPSIRPASLCVGLGNFILFLF